MKGTLTITAAGTGARATSPDDGSKRTLSGAVAVEVKEWSMTPSARSIRAGNVTLVFHNTGKIDHVIALLRTDRPARALAVRNGRPVETGRVGRFAVLPGETQRFTLSLRPGAVRARVHPPRTLRAGELR